ncbi:LysR family transcriptional regulator [uncultured Parasutterella sp.]|uniref:LysR family transcriptional regulator n=2 Tax=uncultured Parasutterella sp. TaxID=1263098 RepID=UPI0025994B3C|nr:LysR family transcriptional regulator [uncultured Parasutterella sp.]
MPFSMDLNLALIFYELYACRSISKAAAKLGSSQPTVSRRLQELRLVFEDPLFISNGHELSPTNKAVTIYPEISKLIADANAIFHQAENSNVSKVVIACSDDFEYFIGPKIIEEFSKSLPDVLVIFHQVNTLLAEQIIIDRKADFCITAGGTHSNIVAREGFGTHKDVCLYQKPDGSSDNQLSLSQYLKMEHFSVHFGGSEGVSDEILRRNGFKRKLVGLTSHYCGIERYILGTGRVVLVPVYVAKLLCAQHPDLVYCDIPFNSVNDPVELSYRKDSLRSKFFKKCRDVLVKVMKSTDWN